MKILFLLFAFIGSALSAYESNIGNIYPQLTFQRTLYADDVYSSGYCIETGLDADRQGADVTDGYKVYQYCMHGRIDNWPNGVGGSSVFLQAIKQVAWADLGTIADISNRYSIKNMDYGSIFESIRWDPDIELPGLILSKNGSDPTDFVRLTPSDYTNLTNVGVNSAFIDPIQGHVYLVRVCDQKICNWEQTELYYKFIALNSQSPFAVRWNTFYTNFEVDRGESESDGLLSDDSRSKVALGFAVTTFIMLIIFLIYAIVQKRKASSIVVESSNTSTMATAYQAI